MMLQPLGLVLSEILSRRAVRPTEHAGKGEVGLDARKHSVEGEL